MIDTVGGCRDRMPKMRVRGVDLFVEVLGSGDPLVLMHGGPGADHHTLAPLRRLADEHTLVLYDHRCNGRSDGIPIDTMTWPNLVEDADALRDQLGFERWAVLGHSFGGMVAMEYAIAHPDRVSRLVLLDTGGDARLAQVDAPARLAAHGWPADKVELVRRWFNGEIEPGEMLPILLRIGDAYASEPSLAHTFRDLARGQWRVKIRPEALIQGGRVLSPGWTVMDRLGSIEAPTLVIAGVDDFIFPPEHQGHLARGIPDSELRLIDHAGHNAHSEREAETLAAVRNFLRSDDGRAAWTRAAVGAPDRGWAQPRK